MHRSRWPIALIAGLGILTIACSEGDVVGPDRPAFSTVSASGFLKCSVASSSSSSKYITPGKWDTLRVGPHRLIFQPQSLGAGTTITATVSTDSSRSVKFGPEGLTFKSGYEPNLQLSVQSCSSLASTDYIAFTDDKMSAVKEQRASSVDLIAKIISAKISHFSRYAVHH